MKNCRGAMTEAEFNEARQWLLKSVPEAARRWAPMFREGGIEWNLYPHVKGIPTEIEIINELNHLIAKHVWYGVACMDYDIRSGSMRIVIEELPDEGVRAALSFVDEVCENMPPVLEEEGEEDGE